MDTPSESGTSGSRVAKNTTYLTVALIGQKILSFLYVFLLARLVGVTSAGDYFSSLAYIGLFSVFIDLGLTPAFIRQTARDPAQGERDLQSIINVKILTSIVVAALLLLVIHMLTVTGHFHTEMRFLQLAAFVMVIDSFSITLYGYLRGIQRLEYESVGIILHRVTIMLVGIIGLQLGAPPIMTMFALLAGSAGNFLFVVFQLWKRGVSWRFNFHWSPLRPLLVVAFPFALAAFFSSVYATSDNVLLSIFSDRRAVGLYATAAKVVSAFTQIFPAALVAAIFPAMSASFIQDKNRLAKIFRDSMQYLMIVAVPLTIALALLATPIMRVGWGKVWIDADWPLRVLAIGLPFLFLNFPVGYLLNAANRQTRNTVNIAITVIFNVGANLLFIQQYSFRSVAVLSVISSALLFFLGFYQVGKIITMPTRALWITLGKTVVAGLLVTAVGWWLLPHAHKGPGLIMDAAAMAAVYFASIFFLRLVTVAEISHLLQRIRRT